MPSYVPPKKNTAFIVYVSLASQANANTFQSNPTLAAGDFKVSIDGGALANLTTLPTVTPASGKMVKISLSTSEMNGDNITVVCSDASGAEWRDLTLNIHTSAQQIDDLATQASVNTIDDFLDTEMAAVLAAVDTEVASILTAVQVLQAGLIAVTTTAQAGAAGTITLNAAASATDDLYVGMMIYISAGTGVGQARLITDYVGSTKVATISPNWTVNPASGATYNIIPHSYVAGLISILTGGITSGSFAAGAINAAAIATDAIDNDALAADAVTAIQSGLATAAALTTIDDFLDTEVAAILAAVDTEIAAIKAKTDNLPTDPADASDIAAAFAVTNGKIDVVDDFLDTEIAAIKAKTDNLPSDPADASVIAAAFAVTDAKIDVVDDFLDTEIAAIKAKTDNLPAAPAAVGDIPTAAAIADAVLDEAITEPSGVFAWAGGSLRSIIGWMGALSRNKMAQTATTSTLRNDADSADLATSAVADDGTTFTRDEWA